MKSFKTKKQNKDFNQIIKFCKIRLKQIDISYEDFELLSLNRNGITTELYRKHFNSEPKDDFKILGASTIIEYSKTKVKIAVKTNDKFIITYKTKDWFKKRKEVFNRDNNKCIKCSSPNNLCCHHKYYIGARSVWEYPLFAFETLCDECHNSYHKKVKGYELVLKGDKLKAMIETEQLNGFFSSEGRDYQNITKKQIDSKIKLKTIRKSKRKK